MRWGQLSGSGLRFYIILKLKTQSVLIRHLLKKDQLPQCIHLWFRLLEICMFFVMRCCKLGASFQLFYGPLT